MPQESELKSRVISALRTVFDPEIPINIYDLGLIYNIDIASNGSVTVRMTLTSPNCPVADKIPQDVQRKIAAISGVTQAKVDLVFDPPWTREMMSEIAQLELEMMGISAPDHLHKPRMTDVTIGRTTRREPPR